MKKPEALRKGDSIGIVAPAGKIAPAILQRGIARIKGFGFNVIESRHLGGSHRYFSGTDSERAGDLQRMFSEDVRAILCARGGYGSSRLIPYLQNDRLRNSNKIFIGNSDLTSLLLHFSRLNIPVFHGPMISYFGREENPLSDRYFIRMLTDSAPAGKSTFPESEVLKPGVAEGRLAGGCLSLVCHSLGTPFEIRTDKRILFLEDVNEAPYRIDRMLTQLRLAGKLDRVAGILFGEFLNCEPPPGTGYSLKDVLADCLREYKMPVLSGLPFGHGQKNITLPFGLRVRMDTSSKSIHFLESPVTGNCYPTDFRFGE